MTGTDSNTPQSATDYYWSELPKYIAAVEHAIATSQKIAMRPSDSRRQYWASVLFTRLCSAATSVLHLCPGSPVNRDGKHWDFSYLAPIIRSVVQTALMLFYLGTEAVGEDESKARLLVMQLRDCMERLRLFQDGGADHRKIDSLEKQASQLRSELKSNPYFARLPSRIRRSLIGGDRATILTDDEILDRLGVLDPQGRGLLRFCSSHADVSPLSYYRTGDKNRGRGEENEIDVHYTATAIAIAREFVQRADSDIQILFRDALTVSSVKKPSTARDERFESAFNYVRSWQGSHLDEFTKDDDPGTPLLCSDCFHDEGLRLISAEVGQKDMSGCPNCGSQNSMKLTRKHVALLAQRFFVRGSIRRTTYGGYPEVQFNTQQPTSIDVAPWLEPDIQLIEKTLQVGFFRYSPRLWMVGEVEPLKALQNANSRAEIISRILNDFPGRILDIDEHFYRVRKDPAHPDSFSEYDSPPVEKLGKGRLDTPELPILYGSQDLEVCLHECRVAAEDEIFIATLAPSRRLRLLNLAEVPWEETVTEFESLDMAIHMLFLAGNHSYEISRDIAFAAHRNGFDGLVYPSYFTLLRTGATPFETILGLSHRRFPGFREYARRNTISNLALFGSPIAEGLVTVRCIDRVMLNKVEYKLNFGPLLTDTSKSDKAAASSSSREPDQ